jgi:hypothetical protein
LTFFLRDFSSGEKSISLSPLSLYLCFSLSLSGRHFSPREKSLSLFVSLSLSLSFSLSLCFSLSLSLSLLFLSLSVSLSLSQEDISPPVKNLSLFLFLSPLSLSLSGRLHNCFFPRDYFFPRDFSPGIIFPQRLFFPRIFPSLIPQLLSHGTKLSFPPRNMFFSITFYVLIIDLQIAFYFYGFSHWLSNWVNALKLYHIEVGFKIFIEKLKLAFKRFFYLATLLNRLSLLGLRSTTS